MAKKTTMEVLKTARERWERAITADSVNRAEALGDLRFKNGDQWDESARARRMAERRPCLTVNKMKTFVHQITNDQRQNRPAISVSPVGDRGDKHTAEVLRGLIRAIERQSDADVAYDTGFDSAVSCGFGYWRIISDYEDEDSFDQSIFVKRVRNPFTVYMDPDRQQPDGSDAKWAFVSTMIPREEFRQEFPKADDVSWDIQGIGEDTKFWADKSNVRVAEYFTVETEMKALVRLANGHTGFKDELDPELKARLDEPGFVDDEREAECCHILWRKITCKEILEERRWPGKWIPIVECIGDEIDIEGRVTRAGLIRDAKDAQRMKNYWATSMTERVALETKSPWVMAEGQIEGHEEEWRNANTESRPVLTYKPTDISGKLVPPPQRQSWMGPPAGVMAAEAQSEQDMMTTTGVRFDATKSERINEESGIALKQLHSNQQLGAYHYIDNLARSLKHTGRIIIDLIPHIYTEDRILTIINEDGTDERVMVAPQQGNAYDEVESDLTDSGKIRSFNPNVGKYEVAVTIGPSYQTKMQEESAGMMEFGKAFPQTSPYIADLVAKAQIWSGSDQIAKRLETLLPPAMLQPEQKDIPSKVQAYVSALQNQLQQAQQQMQAMGQELQSKEADRQVERERIQAELLTDREKIKTDFIIAMEKMGKDFAAKMEAVMVQRDMAMAEREDAMLGRLMEVATNMREGDQFDEEMALRNKELQIKAKQANKASQPTRKGA